MPEGAASGPVLVTVGGQVSNSLDFTLIIPPYISGISPEFGVVGTEVTILGDRFEASQGDSTVTFNGIDAGTASSWSDTLIICPVPQNAITGEVMVTVDGVPSNSVVFNLPSFAGGGSHTVALNTDGTVRPGDIITMVN